MVKIILSKIAKNDLREIVNYIKRDSERYAILERKKIETAIDRLKVNPLLGKHFSSSDPARQMIFQNYAIIYEITLPNQIQILTIHHHARSITRNPAFKEEDL